MAGLISGCGLLQVAAGTKELVRHDGGLAGLGRAVSRATSRAASTSASKPQSVQAQAQEAVEHSSSPLPLTALSDDELMMKETGKQRAGIDLKRGFHPVLVDST